jgi:hypothetical protein
MPGILSPVKLPKTSQRVDVTTLFDSSEDIRFATAAILSSRFPYVSPAGSIHENYFVDGGYVDNAGSGIMINLLETLDEMARDTNDKLMQKYKHCLRFHVIHIYNSPITVDTFEKMPPLVNDLFTPILTLAGMQGSSTRISNADMEEYFKEFNKDTANAVINYSLYLDTIKPDNTKKRLDTVKHEESYPMSWVISFYQLNRMHNRLIKTNEDNKDKFWFLKDKH